MENDTPKISVAVVEDDVRLRQTISMIIDQSGDCCCAGVYRSGEEAIEGIPTNPPRVIIMDVNLPGINGVECVRQLIGKGVESHILMLTVHKDTDVIFDALTAGAVGYLLKPVRPDHLLNALRDIHGGGAPMTSSIARKVVQAFQREKNAVTTEVLSEREKEVLDWLATGHLYKEIADKLQISYRTVHTHVERIYKKLHVNSRAQAVAKHWSLKESRVGRPPGSR